MSHNVRDWIETRRALAELVARAATTAGLTDRQIEQLAERGNVTQ